MLTRRCRPLAALALVLSGSAATAGTGSGAVSGAPGIGDPYFPLDGNGGIDVRSYEVHDRYQLSSGLSRVDPADAAYDRAAPLLRPRLPAARLVGPPVLRCIHLPPAVRHELLIRPSHAIWPGCWRPRHRALAERQLGRYPFAQHRWRGHRPRPRVLAGEPDPADLPGRRLPAADGPRAGPPVVRRLGLGAPLVATSGSTRASRPTWSIAGPRPTAAERRRAGCTRPTPRSPTRRPSGTLVVADPGPGRPLRLAGLRARRDDAGCAAQPDRDTSTSPTCCGRGWRSTGTATARPVPSRRWPRSVSGQDLSSFFDAWLGPAGGSRPADRSTNGLVTARQSIEG